MGSRGVPNEKHGGEKKHKNKMGKKWEIERRKENEFLWLPVDYKWSNLSPI